MQPIACRAPPARSSWSTEDTRPDQQFAFYREAICQAFMKLTPERPAAARFAAKVENFQMGNGAMNRVTFPEHIVRRTAADIAASDRRCFYLNLKLAGRCRIRQAGSDVSLSPGQVGIFDSGQQFALLHDRGPRLQVASFWVPAEELTARLPGDFDFSAARVSDDPHVGHLICETARALNAGVARLPEADCVHLFHALLELVAIGLSKRSRPRTAEAANLVDTTTLILRRVVDARLREPGLTVADVAADVGISERYVHKLMARSGISFTEYVIDRRLDGAARDMDEPSMKDRPIGAIAFDWGFSDLSHFTRRFKRRFGCRPRDFRAR
jgi:AraC family transcriptional regulator, positive regulator of tynA and feaB